MEPITDSTAVRAPDDGQVELELVVLDVHGDPYLVLDPADRQIRPSGSRAPDAEVSR